MMEKYKINEIFYSLQGEGMNTGEPAVFIRFSGCNLKCPFCDTDFRQYREMSLARIIEEVRKVASEDCGLCVLTGGEPSLQVDDELLSVLHTEGFEVAMETNGTRELPDGIDFVTLSPKGSYVKHAEVVITDCDEVKIVVDENTQLDYVLNFIDYFPYAKRYYIQPCDTKDDEKNAVIRKKCVQWILDNPALSLSLQTQKILDIR